jgi:nucleoside-diphosphate-sugar epimerase
MKVIVLGGDGFCGWPTCLHLRLWRLGSPRFVDTIVAKFNRGGLSSKIIDAQFFAELPDVWDAFQNPLN